MRMLVVGAGQMGAGIAQTAASVGIEVLLHDRSEALLAAAVDGISRRLDRAVIKGSMDEPTRGRILSHIDTRPHIEDFDVDLAIEAVSEHAPTKRDVFKMLDQSTPGNAILASNTSAISITALGAQTTRPHLVIGMHFMNPVPVMELVEIVRGLETSAETVERITSLAREMGKTPVVVADAPGFVSNRILMPMINEAIFALGEGVADIAGIDTIMRLGMNHPLGPLALADLIGLDTCLAILDVLYESFGDPKYRAAIVLRRYVAAGRLGKKSGEGFYRYGSTGERLEPVP